MLSDLSLQTLLTRLAVLLPVAALSGFCTAWMAGRLGERTPDYDGRLTLDPFAHVDWAGAVAFVIFGLGWIRPPEIGRRSLRGGWAGVLAVIAAGLLPLLLLAFAAVKLLPLAANTASFSSAPVAASLLVALARLATGFVLFNLVPLPPLAAGQLVLAAPRLRAVFDRHALPVSLAMLAVVATQVPGRLLAPAVEGAVRLMSQDAAIVLRAF